MKARPRKGRSGAGAGLHTGKRTRPSSRRVARIMDPAESTLLDVVDNLLNRGVVLNAEIVLALANVDLVHLRLAALLSAADRLRPRR